MWRRRGRGALKRVGWGVWVLRFVWGGGDGVGGSIVCLLFRRSTCPCNPTRRPSRTASVSHNTKDRVVFVYVGVYSFGDGHGLVGCSPEFGFKEFTNLAVSTLFHARELFGTPSIHGDTPHKTKMHPKRPMNTRTLQTNKDSPISHSNKKESFVGGGVVTAVHGGSPGWRGGSAVDAFLVWGARLLDFDELCLCFFHRNISRHGCTQQFNSMPAQLSLGRGR
jgi:hypothetical protein